MAYKNSATPSNTSSNIFWLIKVFANGREESDFRVGSPRENAQYLHPDTAFYRNRTVHTEAETATLTQADLTSWHLHGI